MGGKTRAVRFRVGVFQRCIAWVFGLQLLVVAAACMLGIYAKVSVVAVIAIIVAATVLAWLATGRAWQQVRSLAGLVSRWSSQPPDPGGLKLEQMPACIDADVAALACGLNTFASRIVDYNRRESDFTRDASHELRSPLTVIKMSADMLGEEELSDFGARSVRRIKRATREMEVLVEALLLLARESDGEPDSERFVVNDVLRREMEFARDLLAGRPIQLRLEEPARFAIEGSLSAFSVQCWQLIRNACQQTDQGCVVVSVQPGMIAVSNHADPRHAIDDAGASFHMHGVDRHGFELAIARRISDRFGWPLELQTRAGQENVARIRFPHPLPAEERLP